MEPVETRGVRFVDPQQFIAGLKNAYIAITRFAGRIACIKNFKVNIRLHGLANDTIQRLNSRMSCGFLPKWTKIIKRLCLLDIVRMPLHLYDEVDEALKKKSLFLYTCRKVLNLFSGVFTKFRSMWIEIRKRAVSRDRAADFQEEDECPEAERATQMGFVEVFLGDPALSNLPITN